MWLLLIVFLSTVPDLERIVILEKYMTYEECQAERDRVGFDMAETYPYERDFVIVCQFKPTKTLWIPQTVPS